MVLLYAAAKPFSSWNAGHVQILADGRQFVAFGIHPFTRKEYQWESDTPAETRLELLPKVEESQLREWTTSLEDVAKPKQPKPLPTHDAALASHSAVKSAMGFLPPPHRFDYDNWLKVGMAIHAGLGGSGVELWDQWSAMDASHSADGTARYKPGECAQKWASFKGNGTSVATLFHYACLNGWKCPPEIHMSAEAEAQAAAPHPAQPLLDELDARHARQPNFGQSAPRANPLEYFGDIRPSLDDLWLVDGLIPLRAMSMFYGSPATGKSFLALDMCLHIAMGRQWFGRDVVQGGIIYLAAEGQQGIRRRLVAFQQHHQIPADVKVPFALAPVQLDLFAANADLSALIQWVKDAQKVFGTPVQQIVIDTLSRTIGIGDENSKDMTAYVNNIGRLQRESSAGVLLVHHRPKDNENKTPRGHGSLQAALDTILLLEGGHNVRTATVQKQKDGENGPPIRFKLESREIGTSAKGKPVLAAVVVPAALNGFGDEQGGIFRASAPVSAKMSESQAMAMQALKETLADSGTPPPETIPADLLARDNIQIVACLKTWRDRAIAARTSAQIQRDSARKSFERSAKALIKCGIIGTHDDSVWLKAA